MSCLVLAIALVLLPATATAGRRPVVAVFDVECGHRVKLAREALDGLAGYIASRLTESGQYLVIPRDQLKRRLVQEKADSYKECFDQSCQIEIGKELAAEKTLATRIVQLGKRCTVTLTLYDLKRATTEAAATQHGGCDEEGAVESVDQALAKLLGQPPARPAPAAPAAAAPAEPPAAPNLLAPLAKDAGTVLLDHFDGRTEATVEAFQENGAPCGDPKPQAAARFRFAAGPAGLGQALVLAPPPGLPPGSASYLEYPGGQLLSSPAGTVEFRVYLTGYGDGLTLMDQGPFYGSCAGWTFGLRIDKDGHLAASAWDAFSLNSGARTVPLNTWTRLAASWGPAGARLYIDGELVGQDSNTGRPAPGYGGSLRLSLGTHAGLTTRIDELRISNVQRTTFP